MDCTSELVAFKDMIEKKSPMLAHDAVVYLATWHARTGRSNPHEFLYITLRLSQIFFTSVKNLSVPKKHASSSRKLRLSHLFLGPTKVKLRSSSPRNLRKLGNFWKFLFQKCELQPELEREINYERLLYSQVSWKLTSWRSPSQSSVSWRRSPELSH